MKSDVFIIRPGEWQIRINGEVLPTTWNSRGAAIVGLKVELRRRLRAIEEKAAVRKVLEIVVDKWTM